MNSLKNNSLWFHLMALVTVIIWGVTFVSTKVLLANGLGPTDIFFYRFILSYIIILFVAPKRFWSDSIHDEFLFMILGICGGSLYFFTENTALQITLASNVSLILCTAPLITAILTSILIKGERFRKRQVYGSLMALSGVALVVFNGSFMLEVNPLGDLLTLVAACTWAIYTLVLKRLEGRYSTLLITRKIFFYGVITILPVFAFSPLNYSPEILLKPIVLLNLIFLGFVASMLCFIMWNVAIKHLGAIRTTNYIYIVPLITLIASAIIIDEKITPIAIGGAIFIIGGVYIAEEKKKYNKVLSERSVKEA